jgi:cyclophilin family peptidyl-prolyl cis-trans isomerase/Skp family chaperone for outer membrane proteins
MAAVLSTCRHAPWFVALAIWLGAAAARPAAAADTPVVEEHPHDSAKAKAEFAAANAEMKTLVGELESLQAEYQQPASDKRAVAAKFEDVKKKAQATSDRLEAAGFALAMVDPTNEPAREICGAVVAGALQSDDPGGVISMANMLDKAGAASGDVMLMAATAEMIQSHLDDAAVWLGKAEAAGIQKQKLAELRAAIDDERPKVKGEMEKRKAEAAADDLPRVKITTPKGDIVVELFENEAPNTVANFISLVEKHFYDGTPFHRVIGGFMAQGGDPTGKGSGGPGYAIACEVDAPGARKHFLGTLSMAHAGPNTGGSQFFLTFRPTEHLDGKHTVFGRVVEGFDVLPKITRTEGRMAGGAPDTIVKAEVLRKRGHPYEPTKLPDPRP